MVKADRASGWKVLDAPTTDIRFVIHELGKLTSQVTRLIVDVDAHGKKIGEVKMQ
jgi:hypothetical protein